MTLKIFDHTDIEAVEVKLKWRDVIHLAIKDDVLKKHVEGVLDFFERSSFPYYDKHKLTGLPVKTMLSGQAVLKQIKMTMDAFATIDPQVRTKLDDAFKRQGLERVPGKLVIGDHDNKFRNDVQSGSNTFGFMPDGSLPAGILLGRQYLKGARYFTTDGQYHPVTVDGVLLHELAGHVAYRTTDEMVAMRVEGILTSLMGAPARHPRSYNIKFQRGQNGGYRTLYDKLPGRDNTTAAKLDDPNGTPKI